MSFIINIGSGSVSPPQQVGLRTVPTVPQSSLLSRIEDTVEFSDAGRSLAQAVEDSSFRIARIRAIRSEIAQGTYETSERLNAVVDRLLDVLA